MTELRASILLQAIDRMSGPMRRAAGGFKRAVDEMDKAGKRAAKSMESVRNVSEKMRSSGAAMSLRLTAPIIGFGALSLRSAANFEAAMNKVGVLTSATGGDLKRLQDQARELGRTTQFSATQTADAMGFLAMAGFDTEKIIGSMPGTLQLAAAANLDLARTADIVTNIMAGYRFEAKDIGYVNDVLVKSFTSANTDLSQLAQAMKYAGPVAKGMGIEFEEAAAVMGIMGDNGYQGTLGGTALRGALSKLVNPARDAQKALGQLGVKKSDIIGADGKIKSLVEILQVFEKAGAGAEDMLKILGDRAGPAFTAVLAGGSEAVSTLTAKLKDAGGTAKRVSDAQMKGLAGEIKKLSSAFEGLQLAIADSGLLEWFTGFVRKLTGWVQGLSESSKTALKWATIIAGLVAVIAPVVLAIGSIGFAIHGLVVGGAALQAFAVVFASGFTVMIGAVKAFGVALLTTPLGWILAAVAAIAAAAYLIYDNWEPISEFFTTLWDGIVGKFQSALGVMRSGLGAISNIVPDGLKGFFGIEPPTMSKPVQNAFPNGPSGTQQTRVGGELHIKIDGEGRPRVQALKSENKDVGITVDTGLAMAGGT